MLANLEIKRQSNTCNVLLTVCVAVVAICTTAPASGQSFEFTGDEGPAWENENNWMPTGVPGQGDNLNASVTIPMEDGPVVPDGIADEFFISTITAPGGLTLGNGNTLNVSDGGTISGFTLDGGTLEPFAGVTVELENNGVQPSQWNSGGIGNNGIVQVMDDLEITSNPGGTIANTAKVFNLGTIEWLGPPVQKSFSETNLASDTAIVNNAGELIFGKGATLDEISGEALLSNNGGTINVNAGDVNPDLWVLWQPTYAQSGGTLNVNSGLLELEGHGEFLGGQINILSGATLHLEVDDAPLPTFFDGLESIDGGGTLRLQDSIDEGFIIDSSLTLNVASVKLSDNMAINGANTVVTNTGGLTVAGTELFGDGEMVNQGTMTVDAGHSLDLEGSITLMNESSLDLDEDAFFSPIDDATLINKSGGMIILGPAADIAGAGFDASSMFVNKGTIEKTAPKKGGSDSSDIAVIEFSHKDGAEIKVETGELRLGNIYAEWGDGGGSIVVNDPGVLVIDDETLTIIDDHSVSGDGGVLRDDGAPNNLNTLDIQLGATLELDVTGEDGFEYQGVVMTGGGTVVNSGQFEWSAGAIGAKGNNQFEFANNGMMEILGGDLVAGTLVNNATVSQPLSTGVIDVADGGTITNNGEWTTEGGNITDDGDAGTFTNNGTFTAEEHALISVPFDNQGAVISNASGAHSSGLTFTNVQQLQNGTLTGGTWIVAPGAELTFEETTNDPLTTIGPGASLTGAEFNAPITEVNTIDGGSLTTNGDTDLEGEIMTENGGSLTIEGAEVTAPDGAQNGEPDDGGGGIMSDMDQDMVIALGEVSEPMLVTPTLDNFGRILPGKENAPGPFNLTGDLIMHDTGHLLIEIGGQSPVDQHDQLAVDGNITLDGRMDVTFLDDFEPQIGDAFTIVTITSFEGASNTSGGAITGQFEHITGQGLWNVTYNDTNVIITYQGESPQGDITNDGIVNVSDLLQLLSNWGACPGCPADLDNSGVVNINDLLTLLSNWG